MHLYLFHLILLNIWCCLCYDGKGFDDTILFDINWAGSKTKDIDLNNPEHMTVTTSHKEKYKCFLPNLEEKEINKNEQYAGPHPLQLISPLFSQTSCSYRLESYWTYEVCHGRFIRQYHEDREGKKVKLQEYILGRWSERQYEKMLNELKNTETPMKEELIPHKKIDGVNLPYFEISMDNGTFCDLNQNKPRETKVLYVCYVHGKHEVYSLKETSTCQYEIIVLSPLLCAHPKYKPIETGENPIHCLPLDGSPDKPHNLVKLRSESLKLRKKSELDHIRVEFVPLDISEKGDAAKSQPESPSDTSPVEAFLQGKNCLYGGGGTEGEDKWWKYEFCYGKSVEQFHIHRDGRRTSINLGLFDKTRHLQWLEQNPHKRPKPKEQRDQLSHFYSGGSICDKTGRPRQTEVKLKCLKNAANLNAVSLYLLEPKYCEYILGVESPLICNILSRADDNGLVDSSEELVPTDDVSKVNIIRV